VWLKAVRNVIPVKEWWPVLKAKLLGHYQYYGVSGNMRGIARFYRIAIRLVLKWLNRRSQRKSFSWDGFLTYLGHYPPIHTVARDVRFAEEPDVGNPQVRFREGH
jgi:RNA-directed DNA polymerase